MSLRQFEGPRHLYESLVQAAEEGTLTQEELEEPNWGVSPIFLIEAARNDLSASRANWLMPTLFLSGFLLGYFL